MHISSASDFVQSLLCYSPARKCWSKTPRNTFASQFCAVPTKSDSVDSKTADGSSACPHSAPRHEVRGDLLCQEKRGLPGPNASVLHFSLCAVSCLWGVLAGVSLLSDTPPKHFLHESSRHSCRKCRSACAIFVGRVSIMKGIFLHEWRRCVCRSCTSHLSRVKKELLDRLHITRKDQSNPTPTKKQHNKTQNECNL